VHRFAFADAERSREPLAPGRDACGDLVLLRSDVREELGGSRRFDAQAQVGKRNGLVDLLEFADAAQRLDEGAQAEFFGIDATSPSRAG
jgi:hypothetical protein